MMATRHSLIDFYLQCYKYIHHNFYVTSTARIGRERATAPPSGPRRPAKRPRSREEWNSLRQGGTVNLVAPSLSPALPPRCSAPAGPWAGPLSCVCQVAMIECSSAIIAHINHHPLKRVNNILPSSPSCARNSE